MLVDKPSGLTSHDVVDILRDKLKIKRIGHTGTLDPMATGLLILLVGSSTKSQKEFQGYNKVYSGKVLFGLETDTWDIQGKILNRNENLSLKKENVYKMVQLFNGAIIQQVPPYSAVKYKGQTLYKLARKNINTPVIRKQVTVEWLSREYSKNELEFSIKCSSGTYVRSIAYQLGRMLACGGCLKELRRESVGEFSVKKAFTLEEIKKASREELCVMFLK